MRKSLGLLLAILCLSWATPTNADTFFSGRVDLDAALGGDATVGIKRFQGFGGHSYTNLDPATGVVNAVGFAQGSNSIAGPGPAGDPASPNLRLNFVFGISGTATGPFAADFDPATGGAVGQLRVYDFGANSGATAGIPSTWVPDINNLDTGLIAVFDITTRPDDVQKGPPGGITTDDLLGVIADDINRAAVTSGDIGANGQASLKFLYDENNPLSTFFDFTPAGYLVEPDSQDLLVNINEVTENSTFINVFNPVPQNLTDLSTIFTALTGGAAGQFVPPTDLAGFDASNPALTGDTSQFIEGGFAVPGSQQQQQVVPEPASILMWALFGLGAVGFVAVQRRKRNAAVA